MDLNHNVRLFINENLLVFDDEAEFTDSDNIFELGFVNSLFAMKLVSYVENSYKIKVENADLRLDNFNSVDNIVKFISSKIAN
jgi:acyl carrier protein